MDALWSVQIDRPVLRRELRHFGFIERVFVLEGHDPDRVSLDVTFWKSRLTRSPESLAITRSGAHSNCRATRRAHDVWRRRPLGRDSSLPHTTADDAVFRAMRRNTCISVFSDTAFSDKYLFRGMSSSRKPDIVDSLAAR